LFLFSVVAMPKPRKRFGQHWLRSEKALAKIVAAAALTADDRVLEIGPGQGVLTRQLLERAGHVVAVELDRDLCPPLVKKFGQRDNFLLLQGDILTLDWPGQLQAFPGFQNPNKVVANIPYNITGPILEHLLGTIVQPRSQPFESIVLLVQKEVALRLVAKPGSSHYSALSIRMGFLADCSWVCDVGAQAFSPPPKVDSAVVKLAPRPFDRQPQNLKRFDTLLKLGFASRRKMLRNNLKSAVDLDQLLGSLEALAIPLTARAEELSLSQWIDLSDRLTLGPTPSLSADATTGDQVAAIADDQGSDPHVRDSEPTPDL
jgi:16S rRNA (adenine1518-N6/adenine1519-N6)-dimethyltransferase